MLLPASLALRLMVADRAWALIGLDQARVVFAVDLSTEEEPLALLGELEGAACADLLEAMGLLSAAEAAILAHAHALMP